MDYFTLVNKEQLLGKQKLNIIKKYGTQAGITDLGILLGGYVSNKNLVHNKISRKIYAGCWWTQTQNENNATLNQIYITHINNEYYYARPTEKQIGIRPAIRYSEILKDNLIDYAMKNNTIEVIRYGEYPQWVVEQELSKKLEELYNLNILIETKKEYTVNKKYKEYEYCSGKYIRFVCETQDETKILSNGRKVVNGDIYWLKVTPIQWLVSKIEDMMISRHIILAGIEYNKINESEFKKTNIKNFLDNTFSKDIKQSRKAVVGTERNEYLKKLIKAKKELIELKQESEETRQNSKKQYSKTK